MTSLNPYLTFDGNCEAAFEFYRSVFGGDFSDVSRFSEAPPDAAGSPGDGDKIMHISLPLGDDQVLMGSDRPAAMGPGTSGDAVSLSVALDDADEARRVFDALAEGGTITMPFERQFWGADFGMCVDRFGIHWMVDSTPS